MPYKDMSDVPEPLKGAGLSLSQANDWARYYDEAKKQEGVEEPAGIAWKRFKSKYKKVGDKWIMNTKPWESEEKKLGTKRDLYGRQRDVIAKKLFGKMFDELTDEQKGKVHAEATKHSVQSGVGDIVFNTIEGDICKFSFIVQTEGIHAGVPSTIAYTKELFNLYGHSMVGKDVCDDPAHFEGIEGYRKLGGAFANVVDTEVIQINNEMIEKFGIDASLADKWALVAHAECYKSEYSYLIRNNKMKFFSSELSYKGEEKNGVWYPSYINYDGMVALSKQGADPGAIMLDVYNAKYGNKMDDKEVAKLSEELEAQKTLNAELETKLSEIDVLKESNTKTEEEKKELESKHAELEAKVKELSAGEFDLDKAKEKIDELGVKNSELTEKVAEFDTTKKELESLNSKIVEMRDEKRTEVLGGVTSNAKIVESIIKQDLDDETFNAKVQEIKDLKEEAKGEVEVNSGIVDLYNAKPDDFEKEWNISKDDLIKEITGGRAE